jgi:TonB-dependent SusC/RagA subfamily outer membrane receptor
MRTVFQLFILFFFSGTLVFAQNGSRLLDQPMQLKTLNVNISTNSITATTILEMEFYNPNTVEEEGLYRFELKPGQVITDFKLDLNGTYRDGSIEEKWKARAAYNTIVGKRVDPALLQMEYYNHYSLNIYPIPAKGTRKVIITIQQVLPVENGKAIYILPLDIRDTVKAMNVAIKTGNGDEPPTIVQGLLHGQYFNHDNPGYSLLWNSGMIKVNEPLSFSILLPEQPVFCSTKKDGKTYFALRFKPGDPGDYAIHPQKVTVFWDVSVSGEKRNTAGEIDFLSAYIARYDIRQLTVISFNHIMKDTTVFYAGESMDGQLRNYLQSLNYGGATQLGLIDFSNVDADAVLLFSDGRNSFGKASPRAGHAYVFCIDASPLSDQQHLEKIIGFSGGRYIDLQKISIREAVEMAGKTKNMLAQISSPISRVTIDQDLLGMRGNLWLITGTISGDPGLLTFSYGNNYKATQERRLPYRDMGLCDGSDISKIKMLSDFDSAIRKFEWWRAIEFGKREKVVTLSTSFIVLEKIEDYVKFNITPPKDLESQCDMGQFVKSDVEKRKFLQQMTDGDILTGVVNSYNQTISWWDKSKPMISLGDMEKDQVMPVDKPVQENTISQKSSPAINNSTSDPVTYTMGAEVIVTALGITRQPKELGYSATRIRSSELTQTKVVNLQNGLTGKVSGLNVQTINNGVFGDTRITLRGIRSLTGNNQPLLVIDAMPVSLDFISRINPNDINDVVILKGNTAAAIYGQDGANGVIIVTTKKGRRNSWYYSGPAKYKLTDREEVDYMQEIRMTTYAQKMAKYRELKLDYGNTAGFYIDIAQHFYESGLTKEALPILFLAEEINVNNQQLRKAIAYTLESWKKFDEAIRVYWELLEADPGDIHLYRDLALSYYQKGDYQQAVNIFYEAITANPGYNPVDNETFKSMMLQEMNAIIAIHKDSLDLSRINKQLIRAIPVDLRITLECNAGNLGNTSVKEPSRLIISPGPDPAESLGRMINQQQSQYNLSGIKEYQVKTAVKGKYKIEVTYHDYWYSDNRSVPTLVKITTFRNFGRPGQTIEIENVIMDNQYGTIEIAEVLW